MFQAVNIVCQSGVWLSRMTMPPPVFSKRKESPDQGMAPVSQYLPETGMERDIFKSRRNRVTAPGGVEDKGIPGIAGETLENLLERPFPDVERQQPLPSAGHGAAAGQEDRPNEQSRGCRRKPGNPVEHMSTCVRRGKARFHSGCKSHPATIAPAGSNRSGRGGNEAIEASGERGRLATRRACRP